MRIGCKSSPMDVSQACLRQLWGSSFLKMCAKGTWICIIALWALPKLLSSLKSQNICFFCHWGIEGLASVRGSTSLPSGGDLHACFLWDAASHLVLKGTFVHRGPRCAACKSITVCIETSSMFLPGGCAWSQGARVCCCSLCSALHANWITDHLDGGPLWWYQFIKDSRKVITFGFLSRFQFSVVLACLHIFPGVM